MRVSLIYLLQEKGFGVIFPDIDNSPPPKLSTDSGFFFKVLRLDYEFFSTYFALLVYNLNSFPDYEVEDWYRNTINEK